jgi:hypothetical protein
VQGGIRRGKPEFCLLQVPHHRPLSPTVLDVWQLGHHGRQQVTFFVPFCVTITLSYGYLSCRLFCTTFFPPTRYEETHLHFAKKLYPMTPRRTDTLDCDLFRAKVYCDQVRYIAEMVRVQLPQSYLHLRVSLVVEKRQSLRPPPRCGEAKVHLGRR